MFIKNSIPNGKCVVDVSMEEEFWNALRDIAADRNATLSVLIKEIVATINSNSDGCQTASAFRTYVLGHYLNLPTKQRATVRPQVH